MARTKTCISSDVVRSDAFLSLSHEAQALYFQLNLEADGYGVVTSAAMLMRGCGFDPAALSELEESEFIIPLATESGSPMKVVRHWWEHNNFRGSKTSQSRQMDALKAQVCTVNESRAYSTREECEGMEFSGHDGEVKGIEQLLFLTDVAFMTYPTLEDKVHIIENTVAVAHACGVECPKVAPLAAVEVVNPKMPCTVDADELRKMNAEGKITGCVVDGPLSMDIAIDPEAAHHKGAQDRPAAGHADILLFPDIQAGNLVYKTLVHTADCKNGCILTGTKVPAILTSRSDSFQTKVNSIALAAVVAAGLAE